MDTSKKNRELISALMDCAIPEGDLELAMAALGSPAGARAWDHYHRIGDMLRAHAAADLGTGFAQRLAVRLADEALPGRRGAEAALQAAVEEIGPR